MGNDGVFVVFVVVVLGVVGNWVWMMKDRLYRRVVSSFFGDMNCMNFFLMIC